MNREDIKIGDIIVIEGHYKILGEVTEIDKDNFELKKFLQIYNHYYNAGRDWLYSFTEQRLATSQEIEWLKACIKAGKYIPLEQIPKKDEYTMW